MAKTQFPVGIAKPRTQRPDQRLQQRIRIMDALFEIRLFDMQNLTISEAHGARIPELALDQPHFAERLILLDMHVGVALVGRKIETDLARQQQADRYRSVAGPKNGLTFLYCFVIIVLPHSEAGTIDRGSAARQRQKPVTALRFMQHSC